MRAAVLVVFPILTLGIGSTDAAASTISLDRATFQAQLFQQITDDYSAPGYQNGDLAHHENFDRFTDSAMSAVLGETRYQTTGWVDSNMLSTPGWQSDGSVPVNLAYCAGCNGSFLLDFTSTSVGTSLGVFGVGFDLIRNYLLPSDITPLPPGTLGYHAFVTFGNGSTADYVLPLADEVNVRSFWGITSPDLIRTIHIGLADGGTTQTSAFVMDNLTIGSAVPEPETLLSVGIGLAGLIIARSFLIGGRS